jgi:hypothetical protein
MKMMTRKEIADKFRRKPAGQIFPDAPYAGRTSEISKMPYLDVSTRYRACAKNVKTRPLDEKTC